MTDSRALLEAAIEADPYDRQAYAVLADHLQELGDPRGELIMLQLGGRDVASEITAAAIIEKLGQPPGVELQYALGYARSALIDPGTAKGTRDVLAHPSCRFLVELSVGHDTAPLEGSIKAIAASPRPTLRVLRLGHDARGTEDGPLEREIGDASALWSALPRIEEVSLVGARAELGVIELPTVKTFTLHTASLTAVMAEALAKASWPALERLKLSCATRRTKPALKARHWLGELFARSDMPALRELHVEHLDDSTRLVEILVGSPLLARLTSLTLSRGDLNDIAARTILAKHDAFAHLTTFDLRWNLLSDDPRRALQQQFPILEVAHQSRWNDVEGLYEDADE